MTAVKAEPKTEDKKPLVVIKRGDKLHTGTVVSYNAVTGYGFIAEEIQ